MEFAAVQENVVTIFDATDGHAVVMLEGNSRHICCICFSPCGSLLTFASDDGSISVWDCDSWTRRHTITLPRSYARLIGFSADSKRIVIFSDSSVRVINLEDGNEELRIKLITPFIQSCCFNNSNDTIAISYDSYVHLYDARTGALKQKLDGHSKIVLCAQFSHDDMILASGSIDHTVKLWDMASSSVRSVLRGHKSGIVDLRFNADASRIVSSSYDGTARIWDVSTGICLSTLAGHEGSVLSCSFSEDGSKVITACHDATVKVWDSDTGEQLSSFSNVSAKIACRPPITGSYI